MGKFSSGIVIKEFLKGSKYPKRKKKNKKLTKHESLGLKGYFCHPKKDI